MEIYIYISFPCYVYKIAKQHSKRTTNAVRRWKNKRKAWGVRERLKPESTRLLEERCGEEGKAKGIRERERRGDVDSNGVLKVQNEG